MKSDRGGVVLAMVLMVVICQQHASAGLAKVPSLHVLSIGSDYGSSGLVAISGAADARALATVLKGGSGVLHGRVKVTELLNEQVSKAAILQALKQATVDAQPENRPDEDDTFVFFFAGHVTLRAGQTYLVPHDALLSDTNQLDTSRLIAAADLQAALDEVLASRRLLLFDSNYLDIEPGTEGTYVFHASGPGKPAQQGRKYGHFTAVLLQALQGWADADQDGRVSVLELAGFVGRHLPAVSSDRQFPVIRLYGPDFPLVSKPKGDASPAAVGLADKLDANLVDLIRVYEAEVIAGVQAYGAEHQMDIPDGLVEVIIHANSTDVLDVLRDEVVRLGGSAETEFENILYATLPVAALEGFVMQEAVWRVDWSRQVVSPAPNR